MLLFERTVAGAQDTNLDDALRRLSEPRHRILDGGDEPLRASRADADNDISGLEELGMLRQAERQVVDNRRGRPLHTRQAHLVVTLELQVKQVVWAVLEELDADALAEG